ncbi:HSP20-like domain of uncharacterised function (DUF1813) [Clostridioides difficile]|nr:HSP20-like domain of uncharacterised function (DUF1813) [Clostridioides difficile]
MEEYIEVKSVNTEHCWNVFKYTFESGKHVTLYHKHSINKPYYHKQCSCRTVAEAVERIKQHDEYELNRREVSVPEKVDTSDRRLKVYKGNDNHYNSVSQIRLQGKWLEELGFEPGTPFMAKCEVGKITLTIE